MEQQKPTPEKILFDQEIEASWQKYLHATEEGRKAYHVAIKPIIEAYDKIWIPAWELHEKEVALARKICDEASEARRKEVKDDK